MPGTQQALNQHSPQKRAVQGRPQQETMANFNREEFNKGAAHRGVEEGRETTRHSAIAQAGNSGCSITTPRPKGPGERDGQSLAGEQARSTGPCGSTRDLGLGREPRN